MDLIVEGHWKWSEVCILPKTLKFLEHLWKGYECFLGNKHSCGKKVSTLQLTIFFLFFSNMQIWEFKQNSINNTCRALPGEEAPFKFFLVRSYFFTNAFLDNINCYYNLFFAFIKKLFCSFSWVHRLFSVYWH